MAINTTRKIMKTKLLMMIGVFLPVFAFNQTISAVSPTSGVAGQTLDVTITGSNTHFTDAGGVDFNFGFCQGSSCLNSVVAVNDTILNVNVTIPANTPTNDYTVGAQTDPDGFMQWTWFHVGNPNQASLNGMFPATGNAGQTLDVTISGSNTHFTQATNSVTFYISQGSGTINVNSVTALDDEQLSVNISIGENTMNGDYQVLVSNAVDNGMYTPSPFHVVGALPAQLLSVYPSVVSAGQHVNLMLNGHNSLYTQGANTINFGYGSGVGVNDVTVINDSLIVADVTVPSGSGAGYRDVSVTNGANGTMTKTQALLVLEDPLPGTASISISPDHANAGEQLSVTITGVNTHFQQGSGTGVQLVHYLTNENIQPTSILIVNDTIIQAEFLIPADAPSADWDVFMSNSVDITLYDYAGFHVNGTDPLFAFVEPFPESEEGAYDGMAIVHAMGGQPPYAYNFLGTPQQSSPVFTNISEGFYTIEITDANGAVNTVSFVIVLQNGIYTTQSYVDSIINDTIYNPAIENCEIDFNTIDSIYIVSFEPLPNSQLLVSWHIGYGNGEAVIITDVYDLADFNGVYSLALELFCPTRALGHTLMAFDNVLTFGTLSVEEPELLQAAVYPNPVTETIHIAFDSERTTQVTLTDLTGKIVYSGQHSGQLLHIPAEGLATGPYLLLLESGTQRSTMRLVKL